MSLLTLAVFVAAGTALGTALKDRSTLAILTRAIPVPLFFLSGVFGAIGFQTGVVQDIATVAAHPLRDRAGAVRLQGYRHQHAPSRRPGLILAGFLAGFALLAVRC